MTYTAEILAVACPACNAAPTAKCYNRVLCGLHSPALRAAQTRVRELEQSAEWERVALGAAIQERDAALDKRDELQARNQELESALQRATKILKAWADNNEVSEQTLMEMTDEVIPMCDAALAHKLQEEEVKP